MRLFQSLLFLIFGIGILLIAWQGIQNGELPFGSNFMQANRPNREDNPGMFYLALMIYIIGGCALIVCSFLTLSGTLPPLPLTSKG